ncbi:MAG: DUF547 domain-containing protein [Lautropia sp.]
MKVRWLRWLGIALTGAWLAGCTTLVPAPQLPASATSAMSASPTSATGQVEAAERRMALDAWARVLERFVDAEGEVDFAALRAQREDLDRYVAWVGRIEASSISGANERLAHYINSYNALSMYNVIEAGIPATHAGLAKVRFFVLRKLLIGGERRSLYSYENDVIRPLNEPRIHFALNCSAVSCPVLPRVPFTGASIDAELERETRAFFARASNFRIDAASRTVWLSELLDFYPEDFVPGFAPSLLAYANRYAPVAAPLDYRVRFVPYDWTVANSARRGAMKSSELRR